MDLDALQMSQKSGELFDSMDSGEQPSNVVGDEQFGDTAELNALRKEAFLGNATTAVDLGARYHLAENNYRNAWCRFVFSHFFTRNIRHSMRFSFFFK